MEHIPVRVWQEKLGEISWLCSCGCHNKHFPLPTNLDCGRKNVNIPYVRPAWWFEPGVSQTSQCIESEYQSIVIR